MVFQMKEKRKENHRYSSRSFRSQNFDANRPLPSDTLNNKTNKRASSVSDKRRHTVLPLSSESLFTYRESTVFDKPVQMSDNNNQTKDLRDSSETPVIGFMTEFQEQGPQPFIADMAISINDQLDQHLDLPPQRQSQFPQEFPRSRQTINSFSKTELSFCSQNQVPPEANSDVQMKSHRNSNPIIPGVQITQATENLATDGHLTIDSNRQTGAVRKQLRNQSKVNMNGNQNQLDDQTMSVIGNMLKLALEDSHKRQIAQTTQLVTRLVNQALESEVGKRENHESVPVQRLQNNQLRKRDSEFFNRRYRFPETTTEDVGRQQLAFNHQGIDFHRNNNDLHNNSLHVNPDHNDGDWDAFQEFLRQEDQPRQRYESDRQNKLDKWGLKFDHKRMTVDDFIFRVETFKNSSRCSWQHIFENFHYLVTGKAEQWFWQFRRSTPNGNWNDLRAALIRNFASLDTDSEIIRQMTDRRQEYNESFIDFYDSIIELNFRLTTPKTEIELMEIVRQNVNDQIARLIFNSTVRSMNDLLQLCRRAEKFISERNRKRIGKVSELENSKDKNSKSHVSIYYQSNANGDHDQISNEDVEALDNLRRDTSKYKCWNCETIGHSFIECTRERRIFCYHCGKVGVITPNCPNPKCHTGNGRTTAQIPGTQQVRKSNLDN